MLKEPHERLTEIRNEALLGRTSVPEYIEDIGEITFERFLEFKEEFLKTLKF